MRTLSQFFSGTLGVIMAISFCVIMVCLACAISAVIVPVAFPFPTVTPMP